MQIFITGSSSGIGKALAERFLEKDHNVNGLSRSCSISHPNYIHHKIDLSQIEQVLAFEFEELSEEVVLVNNAATLNPMKHFGNIEDLEIYKAYNLNVVSPAVLTNKLLKLESNLAKLTIINISSGAAQSGYDGWGVYSSSKAALNMLTKVLVQEQEQGSGDVKIKAIAPGVVATAMQSQIRNTDKQDFSQVKK